MPVEITADDVISRCLLYGRFFSNGVHTNRLLWNFGKSQPDGRPHESAVLRSLAPLDEDVHRIGCGIAAGQNAQRNLPVGDKNRKFYCGFRSARFGDLNLEDDDYIIHIVNEPEGGEDAHVDVSIEYLVEDANSRASARTDAGIALVECFGEPVSHRCECDLTDRDHPFDVHGPDCLMRDLNMSTEKSPV